MTPITLQEPATWRDLQEASAEVLRGCGMEAHTEVVVSTARGDVEVDVVADDLVDVHRARIFVECKNWARRVTRAVANGFRTVVADSGAHIGIILSRRGFQRGAVSAVANTNVRLLTWDQFQALYVDRWYDRAFRVTIDRESEVLADYTEPINPRVNRAVQALSGDAAKRYQEIVQRYWSVALLARVLVDLDHRIELPIRRSRYARLAPTDAILGAASYSGFLAAMCGVLRAGVAALEEVFGGTLVAGSE